MIDVCPVSLAELCIASSAVCTDDQIYDIFLHQKFKKITYSRSRFDFPNTLIEILKHHHGLLQFVNNTLPYACCEFWFQLAANFMSGCLSKYFFTSGCLSKVFFKEDESLITNNNVFWSNYFTHWNEWILLLRHKIVYEWKMIGLRYSYSNPVWIVVCTYHCNLPAVTCNVNWLL
jgi:hypothetical protein